MAENSPENIQNAEELILDIASQGASKEIEKSKTVSLKDLFDSLNDWMINSSSVPLAEKLLFFQLVGAMSNAGLPIVDSLQLLLGQTKNPKMVMVIKDMITSIEAGESLAGSMRQNNDVFDEATCSVVEAGEKSGKLNDILKELVSQYEQLDSIKKKIKSVMTYPIVVFVTMILLTVVVLVFVVPKLVELFGSADSLPLPTRILITGSDLVINNFILLLIGIIAVGSSFVYWKKTRAGGRIWGSFLFMLPIVGDILQKMVLTKVSRIFGFLMTAGVPVVESLKIASHVAENDLYQEKLLLAADDLTKGISIAENLSDDEKLFPKMIVNMMAIGEKTASLDTIMSKAADFYKDELERKVEGLSKIMEPIIMAIIACGVVFMILAIYLPILKMNDKVVG